MCGKSSQGRGLRRRGERKLGAQHVGSEPTGCSCIREAKHHRVSEPGWGNRGTDPRGALSEAVQCVWTRAGTHTQVPCLPHPASPTVLPCVEELGSERFQGLTGDRSESSILGGATARVKVRRLEQGKARCRKWVKIAASCSSCQSLP